ncbi:MAG: hypothetical protein ACR2NP_15010, partial [Pirellulaceae bacterium]
QVVRVSVSDTIQDAGFWLPVAALQKDARGLWTCLVLEPHENGSSQVVARRLVEVLHTEQDRVFVRGTLGAGDLVIDQGGHRVVIGQRVKQVNEPERLASR